MEKKITIEIYMTIEFLAVVLRHLKRIETLCGCQYASIAIHLLELMEIIKQII